MQKGLREELLCRKCEQHLNDNYEKYSNKVLRQIASEKPITTKGAYNLYSGVDYSRFKLFILSLYWRASIAQNEPFTSFNLEEHEEPIRKMLFDRNPGNPDDYPSSLYRFSVYAQEMNAAILSPVKSRRNPAAPSWSIFAGLACFTTIATSTGQEHIAEGVLREDNILSIGCMTLAQEKRFINDIAEGLPAEDRL